jgi:hypothetical protein
VTQAVGDLATAAAHADSASAQSRLQNVVGALGNEGDAGITIVTGGNAPGSSMSANGGDTINVAEQFIGERYDV